MEQSIAVGTSGWSYDSWAAGAFYPEGLGRSRWLAYYAARFPTAEINATFYRLPSERSVTAWRDGVPDGFEFAVKGSRLITHARRLRDRAAVETFVDRVRGFGDRLAVILWQLPPNFERDDDALGDFLGWLPREWRNAVEFRHPSWYCDEVQEVLHRRSAAQVWVSSPTVAPDTARTAPFVYLRMHGLAGGYRHDYTVDELAPWVAALREVARDGERGFVYFNNDGDARAPRNASTTIELLRRAAVPWSRSTPVARR